MRKKCVYRIFDAKKLRIFTKFLLLGRLLIKSFSSRIKNQLAISNELRKPWHFDLNGNLTMKRPVSSLENVFIKYSSQRASFADNNTDDTGSGTDSSSQNFYNVLNQVKFCSFGNLIWGENNRGFHIIRWTRRFLF